MRERDAGVRNRCRRGDRGAVRLEHCGQYVPGIFVVVHDEKVVPLAVGPPLGHRTLLG
jgi:hypothetical protein